MPTRKILISPVTTPPGHINNAHLVKRIVIEARDVGGELDAQALVQCDSYMDKSAYEAGAPADTFGHTFLMKSLQEDPNFDSASLVFIMGAVASLGNCTVDEAEIPQPPVFPPVGVPE